MIGFILAVTLLSLISGGQSAPVTNCESLTQPIEIQGRDQLFGKWVFSAESTNFTGSELLMRKFVESAWVKITASNESDGVNVYQSQKMYGGCFTVTTKMTLANNTLSKGEPDPVSEVLLTTSCPDCLIIYSTVSLTGASYSCLQLLSRRNKVTAAELQEFVKQSECLNLPPPYVLDPEKELCPDESSSQETHTIDLTSIIDGGESEVDNLMDRIINREGGLQTILKLFSSSLKAWKDSQNT